MSDKEMFNFQNRSLRLMKNKIEDAKRMVSLTNHSKKKMKHLSSVKFYEECLEEMNHEYDNYWRDLYMSEKEMLKFQEK